MSTDQCKLQVLFGKKAHREFCLTENTAAIDVNIAVSNSKRLIDFEKKVYIRAIPDGA